MNYGNGEQVLQDDEMIDIDGKDHDKAPCDANVVMLSIVIPNIVLKQRSHSRVIKKHFFKTRERYALYVCVFCTWY